MIYSSSRVSARYVSTYDKDNKSIREFYASQIEYFENEEQDEGKLIFISDKETQSGLVEKETELEAITYAMEMREKLAEF